MVSEREKERRIEIAVKGETNEASGTSCLSIPLKIRNQIEGIQPQKREDISCSITQLVAGSPMCMHINEESNLIELN